MHLLNLFRIFLIFFVNSLQQQTSNNLVVYVTSSFTQVYLIPITSIVSTIVGGVIKLPVAKLMDIFGRPQGYMFMLACAVLGKSDDSPITHVRADSIPQV